jgi:membrane-anchored protein YejM (alkaline phosphatase superfamily)
MEKNKKPSILSLYFVISYVLLLINASVFLRQIQYTNFSAMAFAVAVFVSYCCVYLLPVFLALNILRQIVQKFNVPVFFKSPWFVGTLAVVGTTFVQLLIYVDSFIFKIFGFHFNGFVWNLIFTKGGIESMGSSQSTTNSFIYTVLFFLVAQTAILIILLKAEKIRHFLETVLTRPRLKLAFGLMLIIFLVQSGTFGIASFYTQRPILTASKAFPFYMPVTFKRLAKSFGIEPPKNQAFDMKFREINLKYPLKPIEQKADGKKYNIVFLMAESLRADMLNPKVMPQTWAFSQKAIRFEQHYSGGNGTRMGMFGAFYGLYGNYWFKFLEERKGPVLMDLLIKNDYQISVYSSAKFSYPEFDKTIFAGLAPTQLHDSTEIKNAKANWELDRINVDKMLDFIGRTDKSKPFMTFMFFESPHAHYYFPPENEIAVPYLEEFNYADIDPQRDMPLIKNRYLNSCNHLDSQYGKILKYLEENELLDSTIVLLTGDHGEEFMEKGRWGHNSTFSEEQVRTPLVLWAPEQQPRQIDSITSHLDIPATLMTLLGVSNQPQDYSDGIDLLAGTERTYAVVSGWDTIAYIDNENKAVFPMNVIGDQLVTTKADVEVKDPSMFYQQHKSVLIQIMKDMSQFSN